MADWFKLSTPRSTSPLPLSLAVSVAAATVNRFHRGFQLNPSVYTHYDPSYPRIEWLGFVDVFVILFENIVTHCGFGSAPAVEVGLSNDGADLIVRVENLISKSVATDSARLRVTRIREEMERGESQRYVSKEGETGLHKIKNWLSHDLRADCRISFDFIGGDKFYVEIRLAAGAYDGGPIN